MTKLNLKVVHDDQSNPDTLKMFLWGDRFLARVVEDGIATDRTVILRIEQIARATGQRRATLLTNYGRFDCMWPYLEQIE